MWINLLNQMPSERDRLPTAEERIPWDWIREADKIGIRTLGIPKKFGGEEANILTLSMVGEELAAGDLGFAVIMDQCWKMAYLFGEAMTPEQQERFIPPFVDDPEATNGGINRSCCSGVIASPNR